MKKTYHIITIGCQMNKSDSERIASYLEFYGLKEELKRDKADFIIINTCGVRQRAEDRNYGLIPKIKRENKKAKIILAGCLSERKDVKRRLTDKVDIWMPIRELPGLYKKLGLKGKKTKREDYLGIEPKVSSSFSAFIPIGNGCNNFCAYCVVPIARGREAYRNAYEIIEEIKCFLKKGYKEIILIAQNVNSFSKKATKKDLLYFKNKKIGQKIIFSELLERVAREEGNFWIRFSTSHPKDLSNKLIEVVAKNDKICNHIHLPAQSGDDRILKSMNRKYTRKDYLKLIKKIKEDIPMVAITTDIIVGFPSETKKEFNGSVSLFREVGFDMAYISQYSPRPGTAAYKLKDTVVRTEKKKREEELMKILRKTSLANNKKFVDKNVLVLIEIKNKNGEWCGKNEQNKVVKIKNSKNLKNLEGKFILVKIEEVENFGLKGILIK